MPQNKYAQNAPEGKTFPDFIAAIGFSAGGVEALGIFFKNIPKDLPVAYIVAQHFPDDRESKLPHILAGYTEIPVEFAQDGSLLESGKILILPPGRHFIVEGGRVVETKVSADHPVLIDTLFESLAIEDGECAMAVVLSGTGSDGARGAKMIKEEGGYVFVQSPDSAIFRTLPESVIMTSAADFVLAPDRLAAELVRVSTHVLENRPPRPNSPDEEMLSLMRKLTSILKRQTGLDLAAYKQQSVVRRIERRMGICQVADFDQYVAFLRKHPEEAENLAKDMLISVTRFFRDEDAFSRLKEIVIPRIVEESRGRVLRAWVPGCATGEEVYSLAILIEEGLQEAGMPDQQVKIFATDLDRKALEIAGQGLYPASIAEEVPPLLLEKYFNKQGDHYQISRSIRERIIFAKHNVLKDPPFTRMDIVSCRNLLIYLQPAAQQCVLSILHFALRTGGVLMLGLSEALGDMQNNFSPLDIKQHLFCKRGESPLFLPNAMQFSNMPHSIVAVPPSQAPSIALPERTGTRVNEVFTNRILSRLNRTCFVLNERSEILYSFGHPEKYVSLKEGRSSLNLVDIVPRDLAVPLSTALENVHQGNQPIHYAPIAIGDHRSVGLIVESFQPEKNEQTFLLVFLEEGPQTEDIETTTFDLSKSYQRISDLEQELRVSRARLKELVEELEASNEELQTSNEELQASNEELQSTNEELESVNEELQTVNNDCQGKITELTKTNDDMDNFIASADIATIFLDAELRIRRFTPAAARKSGLLVQDIGREISAFSHPLLALAAKAAEQIIAGSANIESVMPHESGGLMLMRATPFIRKDGHRTGATVSFICISPIKTDDKK